MVLFRLDTVGWLGGVHQGANGENYEHEGESVGQEGVVGGHARTLVINLGIDVNLEGLCAYGVIPREAGPGKSE
jgi:hypothetical protein